MNDSWSAVALAGVLACALGTAPAAAAPPADLFAVPATAERLAEQRGGTMSSSTELGGQLYDASASNVTSGANSVRDGSFAHSAGLNTVIQNSGANVLIQNSTTVNVQMR